MRQTTNVSPGSMKSRQWRSLGLSFAAADRFSDHMSSRGTPNLTNASICMSRFCSTVETLAYPTKRASLEIGSSVLFGTVTQITFPQTQKYIAHILARCQ
jgi:hypothetical protein